MGINKGEIQSMNKACNKFSIIFLLSMGICFSTTAVARYELPAEYITNEALADAAVIRARKEILEAIQALQKAIKEFQKIKENGKEDDKVVQDLVAEIRRLESELRRLEAGGAANSVASTSAPASANSSVVSVEGVTLSRKALARVASQKGNGFNDPAVVLKTLSNAIADKPDDNNWKPVKGALNKAITALGKQPNK